MSLSYDVIMPGTDRFSRYHNNFTDNKWMLLKRTTTRGLKSRVLTFSGFTSKGLITFKYPDVLDPGVLYRGVLRPVVLRPGAGCSKLG